MAWSRVQSVANNNSGAVANSVAAGGGTGADLWASGLSSGTKLIAVSVSDGPGVTTNSVSDASGNQFTKLATASGTVGGSVDVTLWAMDTPAGDVGAKPVITAAYNGNCNGSLLVQEVSGLVAGNTTAMLDGTAATSQVSSAATVAQPSYTDTAAGEYLVAVFGDNGGPETYTAPSGYTADANGINGNSFADAVIAYKSSTGGAESGTWSFSGTFTGSGFIVVAFKVAAGGGPPPPGVLVRAPYRPPAPAGQVPPQVLARPVPGPVPVSSADTAHAAEGAALQVTLAGADTGHAAEAGSVLVAGQAPAVVAAVPQPPARPRQVAPQVLAGPAPAGQVSGADSGHAAEGAALQVTLSSADTGHAAEAGSVSTGAQPPGAVVQAAAVRELPVLAVAPALAPVLVPANTASGADSARAAENSSGTMRSPGADTGHAAEGSLPSVRVSSADAAHAAEASGVHVTLGGADTAHAAEGAPAVRPQAAGTADSGHGAESASLHVTSSSADAGHFAEAGSASGGNVAKSSADAVLVTESAFYYHSSADSGHGAEGAAPQVAVKAADRASAAERPLNAWPAAADRSRGADAPASAWPHGDDAARVAEAWQRFRFALADSAGAVEVTHEVGIWTYVPVNVRLEGKYWRVTGRDEHGNEVVVLEGERLEAPLLRLAELVSWSRVTVLRRSADRAAAAEGMRGPAGMVAVTVHAGPAVAVSVTVRPAGR